jgi:hypothetical protein
MIDKTFGQLSGDFAVVPQPHMIYRPLAKPSGAFTVCPKELPITNEPSPELLRVILRHTPLDGAFRNVKVGLPHTRTCYNLSHHLYEVAASYTVLIYCLGLTRAQPVSSSVKPHALGSESWHGGVIFDVSQELIPSILTSLDESLGIEKPSRGYHKSFLFDPHAL